MAGANKDQFLSKINVLPSQKVSSVKNTVWALADKGNDMFSSYCACTAGLSHCCNLAVAFLYMIENAALQGLANPTCTDAACIINDRSNMVVKGYRPEDAAVEKHAASKRLRKQSLVLR